MALSATRERKVSVGELFPHVLGPKEVKALITGLGVRRVQGAAFDLPEEYVEKLVENVSELETRGFTLDKPTFLPPEEPRCPPSSGPFLLGLSSALRRKSPGQASRLRRVLGDSCNSRRRMLVLPCAMMMSVLGCGMAELCATRSCEIRWRRRAGVSFGIWPGDGNFSWHLSCLSKP